MKLVQCSVDEFPCQPVHQAEVTVATVEDFAALGVTPGSISTAVGYGFGFIVALALMPMCIGWIIQMIKKV